jgi:hypothetical protein
MKTVSLVPIAGACAALLLGGCASTPSARIKEHEQLYAGLSPKLRKTIRDGLVDFSFTPEMIYMSLGNPNRVSRSQDANGPVETWTYRNFVLMGGAASKMGLNYPGMPYQGGSFLSTNVPSTGGGPQAPSISSTRGSPWTGMVSDAGAPVAKLEINLQDGKIISMRLIR